jgi:hypothetical protein
MTSDLTHAISWVMEQDLKIQFILGFALLTVLLGGAEL